jgi:hypothetical protein
MIKSESVRVRLPFVGIFALSFLSLNLWPSQAEARFSTVLQVSHPRIFFSESDISRLRDQARTTHEDIWQSIRQFTDTRINNMPPTSSPCGDLEGFRWAGNQLIAFAFTYVITGERKYFELTLRHLLAYADWPHWGDVGECGERTLGFGHMLLGNAIAYDWLYNDLSFAARGAIGSSLARRTDELYEASSSSTNRWQNWWRRSYIQNQHLHIHAALGIAALVLEDHSRSERWLSQATANAKRTRDLLEGITDGTWHEGMLYQNYALTPTLSFLYNLRKLHGQDLIPHNYLQKYIYWRLYNLRPGTWMHAMSFANFEWNWGASYAPQNLMRFTASEYNNGYGEYVAQHLIRESGRLNSPSETPYYVFEFFYYNPLQAPLPPSDLPLNRTFRDLEAVIWRTGWSDDDLIFAMKVGPYGGRSAFSKFISRAYPFEGDLRGYSSFNVDHDHDDAGTFYLYRGGTDLGSEHVGSGRNSTSFHNTLLIDGEGQYHPPDPYGERPGLWEGSDGRLETVEETENYCFLTADLTNRYRPVNEAKRRVMFSKPDHIVITDEIRSSRSHRYEWVSHFSRSVSREGKWIKGSAENGQVLGINVVSPSELEMTTGNDGKPYVRIRPRSNVRDIRFEMVMYPTDETGWTAKPLVASLAGNDRASAIRIIDNDSERDLLIRYRGHNPIRVADYSFDAEVASVVRDRSGNIRRLMLGDGKTLADCGGKRILLQSTGRNVVVEAAITNTTLALYGEEMDNLAVYFPHETIESVTWNGLPVVASRQDGHIIVRGLQHHKALTLKDLLPLFNMRSGSPLIRLPGRSTLP